MMLDVYRKSFRNAYVVSVVSASACVVASEIISYLMRSLSIENTTPMNAGPGVRGNFQLIFIDEMLSVYFGRKVVWLHRLRHCIVVTCVVAAIILMNPSGNFLKYSVPYALITCAVLASLFDNCLCGALISNCTDHANYSTTRSDTIKKRLNYESIVVVVPILTLPVLFTHITFWGSICVYGTVKMVKIINQRFLS